METTTAPRTTATDGYVVRDLISGRLIRRIFTYADATAEAATGCYRIERWDENPNLVPLP